MRIWTFSDWHLELGHATEDDLFAAGIPDADVCVCAGDMDLGERAVEMLGRRVSPFMPVVYVPGNHDYRERSMCHTRAAMQDAAARFPDLHLLDPGAVTIGGVKFVGATLWGDFAICGSDRIEETMAAASQKFGDISLEDGGRWTPQLSRRRHLEERAFMETAFSDAAGAPVVVVSHHAPHPLSSHPRFRSSVSMQRLSVYVSDLTDMILASGASLWIHGHVHDSVDYTIGDTRIFANPRGYEIEASVTDGIETVTYAHSGLVSRPAAPDCPPHRTGAENSGYLPLGIVDVPAAGKSRIAA